MATYNNRFQGPSAGTPGTVWRNGNGAPDNALGINGDYYVDMVTGNVYQKSAGAYAIVGNILGPQGIPGGFIVAEVSDADFNVTTQGLVVYKTISANRVVNLPALAGVPNGQVVVVKDASGTANKTISITPSGADKIDGVNAAVVLDTGNYVAVEMVKSTTAGWVRVT